MGFDIVSLADSYSLANGTQRLLSYAKLKDLSGVRPNLYGNLFDDLPCNLPRTLPCNLRGNLRGDLFTNLFG